jgi:hypothetical protein
VYNMEPFQVLNQQRLMKQETTIKPVFTHLLLRPFSKGGNKNEDNVFRKMSRIQLARAHRKT